MFINIKIYAIILFALNFCIHTYALSDTSPLYDKMFDAITRLSSQMEMFNVHYITKLDEKFVSIMQMMSAVDANVKMLQERSQAWDIFTHHMTAWSEHIKSTDQKFDVLKKHLDSLPVIENQLQNTDFKIQHIFDKTDLINEKFNEMNKSIKSTGKLKQTSNKVQKASQPQRNWSQEDFEQTEILLRLSKIQRMIQNQCSAMRLDREFENTSGGGKGIGSDESNDLKSILTQINSNIEKFPHKEIKQSLNLNKKHEKALDALATTVSHIDERTVRIFDTNSYQYKKIQSTYKNTEGEILTFTNNANFLLKKVEKAMKYVVNHRNNSPTTDNEKCKNSTVVNTTENSDVIQTQDDSDEVEDDIIDQKEYIQPTKTNCFQLTSGRSGVYTFNNERQLNIGGRDFYQQYCEYSTEGTAWTVIQKRDNFELQEEFNRTWDDYKHGFGNLTKDFWFGNDFIHNLTFEHDMVLRIVLEDFKDNHVWIEYSTFKVENEAKRYRLNINDYRGAVADSLLSHDGRNFSTYDDFFISDNSSLSCAMEMGSGWWWSSILNECAESNLNGFYEPLGIFTNKSDVITKVGIFWNNWLGKSPLKASRMMIRPRDVLFNGNMSVEDYNQLDDV
ncbi:angiopoietin-2-like [Chironomus tepperi]|uniref:angiopoietin-2-like n=1 Tax=Chironomus tepperi TaxID=113505 RepID=UPI00391F9AF7